MKLVRTAFRADGVFGRLYNDNGVPLCYCLEHAFEQDDGSWLPKLPIGTYNCVLGQHQLEGMVHPFQTYEITNVPGHTNILLHMGNFNRDSDGCVLLGQAIVTQADGSQMITNSVHTFTDWMNGLSGAPSFTLVVGNGTV